MRRARTTLIVASCAAIGVVTQLILGALALELDEAGVSALPPGEELRTAAYLGVQLLLGVVALVALPITLHHRAPDERGQETTSVVSLVAGVVVVGCGCVSGLGFAAGIVALVSMLSRGAWRWSWAAVVAMTLSWTADLILSPGTRVPWGQGLLGLVLFLAAAAALARMRFTRRQRIVQLEAAASMTRKEIRVRELRAIEEERRRIARDMHDSLSHRLSLVAVHAGALEVRDDLPPHVVRRQASIVREQAELGVADLRAVLTALRQEPDEIDPRTRIDELVAAARAAGAEVRYAHDPQVTTELLDALPVTATHTLRRTVQEGLTNARKHSPGAPVDIALGLGETMLGLTMTNPMVPGRDGDASPGGMGLIGLEERARLAGGRCTSFVDAGTFTLRLELSWR